MGEIPHLQAAVARLKSNGKAGVPAFEIISVSVDDAREFVVSLVAARKFPGIHTWDVNGANNPVSDLYNVRGLPSWYLIDTKGVIAVRDPFGPALIPAVEAARKR